MRTASSILLAMGAILCSSARGQDDEKAAKIKALEAERAKLQATLADIEAELARLRGTEVKVPETDVKCDMALFRKYFDFGDGGFTKLGDKSRLWWLLTAAKDLAPEDVKAISTLHLWLQRKVPQQSRWIMFVRKVNDPGPPERPPSLKIVAGMKKGDKIYGVFDAVRPADFTFLEVREVRKNQ